MTFEHNSALPRRFVTAVLPWLIGLGALLLYLATLNTWANLGSVSVVTQAAGWNWRPDFQQPLLKLALLPFHLLPASWLPLALNVFNAVLAALVLTLLARTVALLPRDRTPAQRELEQDDHAILSLRSAWLPPLLAAAVLGLQISFWENATAITGEMLDTFVVAYVIRCLLEFRIDERQSWLTRAAFLYALGMTNNWALIGLLPAFVIAVLWIKGLGFFNLGFLGRMMLWGFLGLLLYLFLPIVHSLSATTPVPFGSGLLGELKSQWATLRGVFAYLRENYRILVLAATSILPLAFLGLRWSSSFGDNSPLGILIARSVFHVVYAAFFAICLLVMLSPPFSPRVMFPGVPFLTHYYLAAITVGYCAGYFLLICRPAFRHRSRMNPLLRLAGRATWVAVVLMLFIVPAALIGRNLGAIRLTNHQLVGGFVAAAEQSLPAGPASIVSDDPTQLALLRTHLLSQGKAGNYLFYDTQSADVSDYHAFEKRVQAAWPDTFAHLTNHAKIAPVGLIYFLNGLAAKGPVCYLQPSFGYYFERFDLNPEGVVYPLSAFPTNVLFPAALDAATVQSNEQFWATFDDTMLPAIKECLASDDSPRTVTWLTKLSSKLHLAREHVLTADWLAVFYSRAATYWAVELQKLDRWDEAAKGFERALALNPYNIVARINLDFNKAHRAGQPAPPVSASIEERLAKYDDWNQLARECGPFDEPRFTFEQGRIFLRGGLYRQAIEAIRRVTDLQPTNVMAQIWLADLFNTLGHPAEAQTTVQYLRNHAASFNLTATNQLDLARIDAAAWLRLGDKEKAKTLLAGALESPAANDQFRSIAAQIYLRAGLNAEALPVLNRIVTDHPADVNALANRGFACLQLGQYDEANESLTRALELAPTNGVIRLNRAITLLRAKKYAAAAEDYQVLAKEFPNAYQVEFGFAELAASKGDTNSAVQHLEACLKIVPPGSPDYLQVSNRLATLRPGPGGQ